MKAIICHRDYYYGHGPGSTTNSEDVKQGSGIMLIVSKDHCRDPRYYSEHAEDAHECLGEEKGGR